MSGMDRLTLVECLEMTLDWIDAVPNDTPLPVMPGFDRDAVNAVIEAHRRASQAAPAPSDHLVSVGKASGMVEARVSLAARQIRQTLRDYGHRCAETSLPDLIAADVDAALRKQDELHAPAPSDGLREAVDAAWNDAIEAAEAAYAYGFAAISALRRAAPTE